MLPYPSGCTAPLGRSARSAVLQTRCLQTCPTPARTLRIYLPTEYARVRDDLAWSVGCSAQVRSSSASGGFVSMITGLRRLPVHSLRGRLDDGKGRSLGAGKGVYAFDEWQYLGNDRTGTRRSVASTYGAQPAAARPHR
jgi:hypothetical protein